MPSLASRIVNCPNCDEPMVLRNSSRGQFWGCSAFPRCRGVRKVGEEDKVIPKTESEYKPIPLMPGSAEQEAIWKFLLAFTPKSPHCVLDCGPGVGKTHSVVQYCLRAPKTRKILVLAFNRHIAREIGGKLAASGCHNVEVRTIHSFGFSVLRQNFRSLRDPDESKMQKILEALDPMPLEGKAEWRRRLNLTEKLCGLVKNYLLDYEAPSFAEDLERVIDHHAIELVGRIEFHLDMIPRALEECKRQAPVSFDFDDMVWLPVVLDLRPKYPADEVFVDESQDLGPVQHALLPRSVTTGRITIVGDKRQAIYEWRGAAANSIEKLTETLSKTPRGVREFPLTITRRCPKLHVQMAQSLFPNIQALEDAPLGSIESMKPDAALAAMKPGDLAICRVNAPLINAAYSLIRRNVRPVVKGRDIGKGLLQLTATLENAAAVIPFPDEMERLREALKIYRYEQMQKLIPLGDKAANRVAALEDKCDCLSEFLSHAKSALEMKSRIETLFSDENESNAVVLGTVHRTKGLEAARVFVLAPNLIPHPAARQGWEMEGEKRIAWIASTRAKFDLSKGEQGELIFCGPIPPVYGSARYPEPEPIEREEAEYEETETEKVGVDAPELSNYDDLENALDRQEQKHEDDQPIINEDDEPPF